MPRRLAQDFSAQSKARKVNSEAEVKRKADEYHRTGMPYQLAMAVALGKVTLSDALERMARQDKVAALMKRHDLSRALATQIALGHADLERVLFRQRYETHRDTHRDDSILDVHAESGAPLTLDLHGGRRIHVIVESVSTYGFTVREEGQEPEEIHKLQALAAWSPDDWKRVRKVLKTDKERAAEPKGPIEKPQDRYPCSDKRLFRYCDSGATVVMTLLEGMLITGQITRVGRYEIGLRIKGDADVVVFRHALDNLREA